MIAPSFAVYAAARDVLERAAADASTRLKALGASSGPMGLTPDSVKFSPAFQHARRDYRAAADALARLNRANVKRYARELAAERSARRAEFAP